MYRNILVPVDLSHAEGGRKALKIAREIAGPDARITLLYVIPDIPAFVSTELPEGLLERNLEEARSELQAMAGDAGAHAEVSQGHPYSKILLRAEEIGADLVIIASHRPGMQDYFLGSTAARVVRHAQCAVLVDR